MTQFESVVNQDGQEARGAARFDLRTRRERIYGDDAPTRGELAADEENDQ